MQLGRLHCGQRQVGTGADVARHVALHQHRQHVRILARADAVLNPNRAEPLERKAHLVGASVFSRM